MPLLDCLHVYLTYTNPTFLTMPQRQQLYYCYLVLRGNYTQIAELTIRSLLHSAYGLLQQRLTMK